MRLGLLVAIVVVSLLALGFVSTASAAITGYSYAKDHQIVGRADSSLHDYQVYFTVHRGEGVDTGPDVYLNNRSMSWPNDIRFVGQNGDQLDYWIESSDGSTAKIWVKAGYIQASSGTTTVSIYYGKAGDAGASDIGRTFILGDNFSTFNESLWFPNEYISLQSGTEITISTPGKTFYESNAIVSRRQDFLPGEALLIRLKGNTQMAHYNVFFGYLNDQNAVVLRGEWQTVQTKGHVYNGGQESSTSDICSDKSSYHVYEIRRDPDGSAVEYCVDGSLKATLSSNVYTGPGSIMVGPWVSGSRVTVDWIAVRNYTSVEPAHGNWSSERSLSGFLGLGDQELLLIGAGLCISMIAVIMLVALVLLISSTLKRRKQ